LLAVVKKVLDTLSPKTVTLLMNDPQEFKFKNAKSHINRMKGITTHTGLTCKLKKSLLQSLSYIAPSAMILLFL